MLLEKANNVLTAYVGIVFKTARILKNFPMMSSATCISLCTERNDELNKYLSITSLVSFFLKALLLSNAAFLRCLFCKAGTNHNPLSPQNRNSFSAVLFWHFFDLLLFSSALKNFFLWEGSRSQHQQWTEVCPKVSKTVMECEQGSSAQNLLGVLGCRNSPFKSLVQNLKKRQHHFSKASCLLLFVFDFSHF